MTFFSQSNESKDQAVESLRGFAIILVIALHLVNDLPLIDARDSYSYFAYTFQHIRIPLFTLISGYLYAMRPALAGYFPAFIQGKARRILLPLLFATTVQYVAKVYAPGVEERPELSGLWAALVFPYEHFWFLQVIMVLFLILGLLDIFNALGTVKRWLAALFSAGALYIYYPATGLDLSLFSIGTTTYLAPFFLLGLGLARFPAFFKNRYTLSTLAVCCFLSVLSQQYFWIADAPAVAGKRTWIGLAVSISACSLIFLYRFRSGLLAYVGAFAFTIYLYQGFGSGIGRILGNMLPPGNPHLYFLLVVTVTLLFGIAVELVARRIPKIRTVALGLK